ncbi:hypothetical protein BaRGS_00039737 [Batillaria attramentaria]|uniref:C2H2-type domain-containing protein n=1 Tax=Batillaria attramentaria TaxID=370345 RepID=A0ABD0J229_9CAEN
MSFLTISFQEQAALTESSNFTVLQVTSVSTRAWEMTSDDSHPTRDCATVVNSRPLETGRRMRGRPKKKFHGETSARRRKQNHKESTCTFVPLGVPDPAKQKDSVIVESTDDQGAAVEVADESSFDPDYAPRGGFVRTKSRKRGRPRKSLVCGHCPQVFTDRKQVLQHMQKYHAEKLESHPPLQMEGQDKPKVGRPQKSRTCDFCLKVFTRRSSVIEHMRKSHAKDMNWTPKSYLCTECGRSFPSHTAHKYHVRRHRDERPFKCSQCPKSFVLSGGLLEHVQSVHLGLRPYLCTTCGAAFKRQYALQCHLRAHKGVKEHTCAVCGKAFGERHQLTRHASIHNADKPFQCEFCPAKYSNRSGLQIHLKRSKACPGSDTINQSRSLDVSDRKKMFCL